MSQHHTRFKDCEWYSEDYPEVAIGGVGGIGSWLSLFLSRIGVPMKLYDFDTIDYTNMAGQLFSPQQIGTPKVVAAKWNAQYFSGEDVVISDGGIYDYQDLPPIVFSAFDNMKVRRAMFNKWKSQHVEKGRRIGQPAAFIDGRMSVESYQIYIVQPNLESCEKYERELFHDNEVADPVCSMKATSHVGAEIGSKMTQAFTNVISNHNMGFDIRELPFKTAYEVLFFGNLDV